jgi:hypothetical protein
MLSQANIKDVKRKIGEWCKQKKFMYMNCLKMIAQALEMSRLTIRKLEEGKNVTLDTLLK